VSQLAKTEPNVSATRNSRACGPLWPGVRPSAALFWCVALQPIFEGAGAMGDEDDRGALQQGCRHLQLLAQLG
jgi:hypothetical protein